MPKHNELCLCVTFPNHARDVGFEKSLFSLRKHASPVWCTALGPQMVAAGELIVPGGARRARVDAGLLLVLLSKRAGRLRTCQSEGTSTRWLETVQLALLLPMDERGRGWRLKRVYFWINAPAAAFAAAVEGGTHMGR